MTTVMTTCESPTLEGLTVEVNHALASINNAGYGLKQPLLVFAEPSRYVAVLLYGDGPIRAVAQRSARD